MAATMGRALTMICVLYTQEPMKSEPVPCAGFLLIPHFMDGEAEAQRSLCLRVSCLEEQDVSATVWLLRPSLISLYCAC